MDISGFGNMSNNDTDDVDDDDDELEKELLVLTSGDELKSVNQGEFYFSRNKKHHFISLDMFFRIIIYCLTYFFCIHVLS